MAVILSSLPAGELLSWPVGLPPLPPPPQLHMASATEQSNEKHLAPWSAACQADGISNTPLTPYLDQELLYNKHLHVDGTKIEATGFQYEVPCVTLDLLKEVRVLFIYEDKINPPFLLCLPPLPYRLCKTTSSQACFLPRYYHLLQSDGYTVLLQYWRCVLYFLRARLIVVIS